jgi:hypothetical protein
METCLNFSLSFRTRRYRVRNLIFLNVDETADPSQKRLGMPRFLMLSKIKECLLVSISGQKYLQSRSGASV